MRSIASIILFLFVQAMACSQSCLPNGIVFSTQAQIDNFQTNFPGCTVIEGHVLIMSAENNAITNLSGLSILTSIGEYLWIKSNGDLNSLEGLENITSIGGYLHIDNNNDLTSLAGLDNLTSIGGYLWINYNDELTSLSGLDNLTSIGNKVFNKKPVIIR
ncbi:MAG: hypothetical protein U9R60_12870 [Bacteroidota bacterium]|nr:hypothetical protein [Bacteroidota bacterium]